MQTSGSKYVGFLTFLKLIKYLDFTPALSSFTLLSARIAPLLSRFSPVDPKSTNRGFLTQLVSPLSTLLFSLFALGKTLEYTHCVYFTAGILNIFQAKGLLVESDEAGI